MKTFHVDEPREIGKRKQRLSSKDKIMVKKDMSERLGITTEQAKIIKDNLCIFCGVPTNEDLRKWFGKGGKGGKDGKDDEKQFSKFNILLLTYFGLNIFL